ncbi:MAG: hypothetical protein H0U27_09300 [Nitrosopumilus sp.]|nr:hypothetical protein [Nitrosopumilus sp.]
MVHGDSGGTASDESGVVPLAFPLLVGPGAITSVILSFQTAGLAVTMLSIAIVIGNYISHFLFDSANLQNTWKAWFTNHYQGVCSSSCSYSSSICSGRFQDHLI